MADYYSAFEMSPVPVPAVDAVAPEVCRAIYGCTSGPKQTPWNTVDVKVVTPEKARVVLTAARPFDPESAEAKGLAAIGIGAPRT
jgi:hypothetical protein